MAPAELRIIQGRLALVPRQLHPDGFIVCFTTRVRLEPGGPRFCNYGFYGRRGAAENRAALCEGLGLDPKRLTAGYQAHTTNVRLVDESLAGYGGLDASARLPETDALITDRPLLPLAVFTADCVPVVLLHPGRPAVGVVHAGWRGALGGIAQKTVQAMRAAFGAPPEELHAVLGPSIGPCCYRVGADVANRVPASQRGALLPKGDGFLLDLWKLVAGLLAEAGVPPKNVGNVGLCTACRTELFYSHRADKVRRGANAAIAAIAPGSGRPERDLS